MESYKRWSSDDSHLERAKEKLIQRLLNNPERRSLHDTSHRVNRIPEEMKERNKKYKQEEIDFIITDEEGNHISKHNSDRESNSISDQNHNTSDHCHRSSSQFSEKDDRNIKDDLIHEDGLTESKASSSCPYMSVEALKQLARDEINKKLDTVTDTDIQENQIKTWCNEISHNIRGKLIELTENEEKIVVTTYMVPRMGKNAVSVHVQCRKCPQDDNFLVVVVESELMFVWVNLLLSPYL